MYGIAYSWLWNGSLNKWWSRISTKRTITSYLKSLDSKYDHEILGQTQSYDWVKPVNDHELPNPTLFIWISNGNAYTKMYKQNIKKHTKMFILSFFIIILCGLFWVESNTSFNPATFLCMSQVRTLIFID